MNQRTSRASIHVAVLLAMVISLCLAWPSRAQTAEYNTPFLTDAQLEDYTSMTENQIRAFLSDHNSYFQQPIQDVDGQTFDPPAAIAQAATQYRINPQVILTTLEKEHNGVTRTTRPSDPQMRFLMGCVVPNTAREQLICSAERFRAYHARINSTGSTQSGWQVGVAKMTQDGISVTPATKAVAGQFTYTPYAGEQWGGNKPGVGGVYLFYSIWKKLGFSGGSAPPAPVPQPVTGSPYRVGIQAGHWQQDSGSLSCDRTVSEVSITEKVAKKTVEILQRQGIEAEVLPAPINFVHNYSANAFVALHVDFCAGNNTGFKVSRWKGAKGTGLNGSGDASDRLVESVWSAYGSATGLPEDHEPGHFTPCMVEYYALNPVDNGPICGGQYTQIRGISDDTPGTIIEMGWLSGDLQFMTSPGGQEKMATGIANGILNFLGAVSRPASTATILVMDVSGSMGATWHGGVKIESAKSAAIQIVNMLQQETQVASRTHRAGLATFTTDAHLDLSLSADYDQARAAIRGLGPRANTNIGAGLSVANQALTQASPSESKLVILLSDGLTNTGLSPDQILAGPVQEAVAAGTCIYTVGFGDRGQLDEALLERIAAASGCGQYYYATDVSELEKVYIRVRHVSTGNLLAELSGSVAQGETVQAGTFDVSVGQDELAVSLHWPGSALDLQLIDPQGKTVDQNYPGANIATYTNLVYALIQQPTSGTWQVGVFGRQVPQGTTTFDAIASARTSPVVPMPAAPPPALAPVATIPTASPGPAIVVILAVVAAGGVGVYTLIRKQSISRGRQPTAGPAAVTASLVFVSGPLTGQAIPATASGLLIGRGSACNVRLHDRSVSRQHAQVRYASGAWYVQDLGSAAGTFVNGQRVQATRLTSGDQIQIGSSVFTFEVKNPSS